MTTIVEFLEARIAEDEATLDAVPAAAKQSDDYDFGGTDDYLRFTIGYGRAIAECAAKRAIITDYRAAIAAQSDTWRSRDDVNNNKLYERCLLRALFHVVAAYKDHEEYQMEAWG